MWTTENRGRYDRGGQRYPSDLTDEEWGLIKPLIPPAKRGGNKRAVNEREIIEQSLFKNSFSRTRTAKDLGISRVTLYNKMKKYNILKNSN